jgi:hypothetical protein
VTGSKNARRPMRVGTQVLLGVLVASVLSVVATVTSAPPAYAAVQEPFPCGELSAGAWDIFGAVASTDVSSWADVAPRDDASRVIGPKFLGVSVPAPGVRANDGNAVISVDQVVLATGPSHAKNFSLGTDGAYSWEPVDGYLGGDSFTYTYRRPTTGCRNWQVTVTIPPPNRARALDDTFDVYTDRRTNPGSVVTNDVAPNLRIGFLRSPLFGNPCLGSTPFAGDALLTMQLAHGTLIINAYGYFSYDPTPGVAVGTTDTFVYQGATIAGSPALGQTDCSGTRGGRVTLRFVDPPPVPATVANGDVVTTAEDTPLTITPSTLLANDTGASIIGTNSGRTQHGFITVNVCTTGCLPLGAVTSIVYAPDLDYSGPDFFTYTIFSSAPLGNAWPATGTVRVDVTPVTDDPTAVNDSFTLPAHTSGTFDVFANDRDPDHVVTGFLNLNTPGNGSFTWNSNGTFAYAPNATGTYTFVYELRGSFFPGVNVFALVTINVTENPAVDDSFTTSEDTPLHVGAPGVLANDETTTLTPATTTSQRGVTVSIHADGSFDYTPPPNFVGTDTFPYFGSDPAMVSITITPVEDAPSVSLNTTCPAGQVCLGDPDNRGDLDEGERARLRGAIFDPERDGGTLVVDWGDGEVTTRPYPCAPTEETCPLTRTATWVTSPLGPCGFGGDCSTVVFFDFEHVYRNNPPAGTPRFTIVATATQSGTGSQGSDTETATVADVAPTVTISSSLSSLTNPSGGAVTLAGHLSDPGADGSGSIFITWGDNSGTLIPLNCNGGICPSTPLQPLPLGCILPTSACGDFFANHTYASSGTYSINVTVGTDLLTGTATTTATVTIDRSAPTAAPALQPPANAAGWNNTDATVAWNWTDVGAAGIDPANCSTTTATAGEGVQTLQATCADLNGNVGSASFTARVDKQAPAAAPTVSAPPNAAGWNKTNVTVSWHWSDAGGSGIDATRCTSSTATSSDGVQRLTAVCKDVAGNEGQATYDLKVDTTAPSLAPVVTPNPVLLGGSATATPNAAADLSGVVSSSCGSVSTATLGAHSVSCTATDGAGNTTVKNAPYVVGVAVTDVAPATRDKYRAGSTLPLSFVLRAANGAPISATLARQLSNGCNATLTVGALAPVCAKFDAAINQFKASVKLPRDLAPGTVVPIAGKVTVGGVVVGAGSASIVIGT